MLKIKKQIKELIKRILFKSDVSSMSFRLGIYKFKELINKATFGTNELSNFIKILNTEYPEMNIKLLDVGARSGLLEPYIHLLKLNHFYLEGIEPDKKEARAILSSKKYGPYKKIHPVVLSDKEGEGTLYVTKLLGGTSMYEPNLKILKYYSTSPYFEIIKKMKILTTTLNKIYPEEKFDFLALDVQGAEFDILKGGKNIFKNAIGVSFEAHFFEIYKNQKLFPKLHELCLNNDFRLIRLDVGSFDGEIAQAGDCVYVKRHDLIKNKEDLSKCILFALLWKRKEYAEFLLRNYGSVFFSKSEKRHILKKLDIKIKNKMSVPKDGITGREFADGGGY